MKAGKKTKETTPVLPTPCSPSAMQPAAIKDPPSEGEMPEPPEGKKTEPVERPEEWPQSAVMPMPRMEMSDPLWDLYVARVAKAETVHTMRRNGYAIFKDAFIEAKVAFDVYLKLTAATEGK